MSGESRKAPPILGKISIKGWKPDKELQAQIRERTPFPKPKLQKLPDPFAKDKDVQNGHN